jgi:hypothetical protein
MDWLTALLLLLAVGALAGFLWLHFGRTPGTQRPESADPNQARSAGLAPSDSERLITVSYLRRRASHFRDMAVKVEDPVAGARCWDTARLLDRAAEALEHPPEEDVATGES